METDTNIKTVTYNETTELYYYNVSGTISKHLERYQQEVVCALTEIQLQLHYDGIPIRKSSADTLWPMLCSFINLSPRVVFPLNLAMCQTKPEDNSYLDKTVSELLDVISDGITVHGINIPVVVTNIVADAPARAMLKKVKGHTGYYSCGKCHEKGNWVENRMVFLNSDGLIPRSDIEFRNRTHETHHLPLGPHGESPVLELPINMIDAFPQDYMHCVCLGKF